MSQFAASYKKLEMWQKAMDLCRLIYKITANFPKDELYGLVSQMRRCAVSISSNIAEGFARRSFGDKKHLMSVAIGSLAELGTQVELAHSFEYLNEEDKVQSLDKIDHIGKMITNFIKRS